MATKTKLSGKEFFKGNFFADCDKQAVVESLQEAVDMRSDRLFVQLGVGNARSTAGFIMALNELKADCDFLAIDPLPGARFSWDSLCSGIRGSCRPHFQASDAVNVVSFLGPVWLFIGGCPCYRCVKAKLKEWVHRVTLDGFLLAHRAREKIEGSKILSPYHPGKVRYGVLRAFGSTSKVNDFYTPWHRMNDGTTRIWRKSR